MNLKHLFFFLLLFLPETEAISQLTKGEKELVAPSLSLSLDRDYSLEFNLRGLGSTRERLPFWLYHNQRGRVSMNSNVSAWISGKGIIFLGPESYFITGAGVLYQDGSNKGAVIDELYGHFQNSWMYATLGRKQRPELYNGISSSNESILWSLNARPLPGIQLGTSRPIFPFSEEGLGFEGSWNEYLLGNDRYVQGARLHHKEFRFVFQSGDWQVKAGMHHFVQWGGTSPRWGEQPDSFEDYLRVFMGEKGGSEATIGDQLNALGNHVGGYELYLNKEFKNFRLQFFYNHLFEDGTGTRMVNKPDGRYGLFYEHNDKRRFINSAVYELIYTSNQSYKTLGIHKYDNYFNNGTYLSGWTYENRVLGAPFFTPDPDDIGISDNKFKAHHLGIAGQFGNYFQSFPYKLLLSYMRNEGTWFDRIRPKQDLFYALYDIRLIEETVTLNLQLGAEYDSFKAPIYGAGVHLIYKL